MERASLALLISGEQAQSCLGVSFMRPFGRSRRQVLHARACDVPGGHPLGSFEQGFLDREVPPVHAAASFG